jgi:hypothetical protein
MLEISVAVVSNPRSVGWHVVLSCSHEWLHVLPDSVPHPGRSKSIVAHTSHSQGSGFPPGSGLHVVAARAVKDQVMQADCLVHPFAGPPIGDEVGDEVVGDPVGVEVVGEPVDDVVGDPVGDVVGDEVVGEPVGEVVGDDVVGELVGEVVGEVVGDEVVGYLVGD